MSQDTSSASKNIEVKKAEIPSEVKIENKAIPKNAKKGTMLIFCAHSDDQILGCGGTMAKYSKEGYEINTFIFSYGELSYPYMKKEHITEIRIKESEDANKIVGGSKVVFFNLKDGQVGKEISQKKVLKKICEIMQKEKPVKIFTHAQDDFHPDHRAVHKAIVDSYDYLHKNTGFKSEIYAFEISQFWNIRKRKQPILVIDIRNEFRTKIRALHAFKSQINLFSHTIEVNLLYLGVYIRAIIAGIKYKTKMAEIFYKIR